MLLLLPPQVELVLSIAHEMGIKHLKVIRDSNLIIFRANGEFLLKEPSLAPYCALAQKLEEKFDTFEISHAMRSGNHYTDALAVLGSQISFEGPKVNVTINKRSVPITRGGNSCSQGGFMSGLLIYFDYIGQLEHDSFINRVMICQP